MLGLAEHRELPRRAEHDVARERGRVPLLEVRLEPLRRHVIAAERGRDRDEDAVEVRHWGSLPTPNLDGVFIPVTDRKSTRLNSSHDQISYAVFCLKKKTYD